VGRISRDIAQITGRNGTFPVEGDDTNPQYGWRDMTADLSAGRAVGANAPTWGVFRDGLEAYGFSPTLMNEMWITFHPDHDVIEGEDMFFHVHWSPNTTSTGTVRWGVEYTIAKGFDQEAFPASTTVYIEETLSSNKQYQHIITEMAEADGIPMPEVDSLVMVRLFRDAAHANDTFPDSVCGLTADIHYRSGRFATIGKRPNFNEKDA
jgi:hypothetical protein